MAQRHQLFLDFPDTANEGVLRIEDSSIYTAAIPVNCVTLEITPPGYSTPTVLTGLSPAFRLFLNACSIGLMVTGCDQSCPVLQDGIYHIRFSVSPNTNVYVEYNLMRITCTMNKWYQALCWINSLPCDPQTDILILLREMQLVHEQILTSKHLVEDLHDYENGMDMLKFARKKLDNLSRGCSTCH